MGIQSKIDAGRRFLLVASVLAAAASSGAVLAGTAVPIPAGAALKSWQDNGRDGRYVLRVVQGQLPRPGKPIVGTVTSDTDCDADAQGLSHCQNIIRLPDGAQLTVVDSHNMHRFRCLGPGDRLELKAMGNAWVIGTLAAR